MQNTAEQIGAKQGTRLWSGLCNAAEELCFGKCRLHALLQIPHHGEARNVAAKSTNALITSALSLRARIQRAEPNAHLHPPSAHPGPSRPRGRAGRSWQRMADDPGRKRCPVPGCLRRVRLLRVLLRLAPNTHGASVEKKAHKTKCVNRCPHRPIPLRNVYGYPRAEPLRTFFQLIWGKIP